MGKISKIFLALSIICMMSVGAWLMARYVKAVAFDINCQAYINRAAGATDIATAKIELAKAIEYLEENKLTEGTVSVFLEDPRNDVGFWYGTLKSAYGELETFPEGSSPLEKSNYLMRMRESFLEVGPPDGISIYPNNIIYFWWFILSLVGGFVFCLLSYFTMTKKTI